MAQRSKRPMQIPEGGVDHPLFQTLGRSDAFEVMMTFERPATSARARTIEQVFVAWADELVAKNARVSFFPLELDDRSVHFAFIGVKAPGAALSRLLAALSATRAELRELVLSRRSVSRTGELGPPRPDPRMPRTRNYRTEAAWWKASFSASQPPPPSEDPAGMLSYLMLEDRTLIGEFRPQPLFVPGLRIVYNVPNGVTYPDKEGRGARVGRTLRASLERVFGRTADGAPPIVRDHDGQPDRPLECIRKDGRLGYVFSLERETEMRIVYPTSFRYREHELMFALRDTISKLGLEPVIHWVRGHVFLVNVWERDEPSARATNRAPTRRTRKAERTRPAVLKGTRERPRRAKK